MRSRYRVRTWLRGHLPEPLSRLFPKGAKDCGDHVWYRADETTDRCYHCTVGVRQHVPLPIIPDGPEYRMLIAGVENGSPTSARILMRRLRESVDALHLLSSDIAHRVDTTPRGEMFGEDDRRLVHDLAGDR